MDREWKTGDVVRHFKGSEYVIIGIGTEATNSNEMKQKVIYKRLDGTGPIWIRDLDEFNSEVDREKYPDVTQKYRFELIETHS